MARDQESWATQGLNLQRTIAKEELPLTSGTGWQGRTGNKDSQSGIYTWVATVTFIDGETRQFQGQVSLVR